MSETRSELTSTDSPAPERSESPRLTPADLERLAEKIIERMKRDVRLDREREGKSP